RDHHAAADRDAERVVGAHTVRVHLDARDLRMGTTTLAPIRRRTRLSERTCAAPAEILATAMARKRFRFRPPGLKPTRRVGTLGTYRGRLGAAWVIAPIVAGTVIVIAGILMLARGRSKRIAGHHRAGAGGRGGGWAP